MVTRIKYLERELLIFLVEKLYFILMLVLIDVGQVLNLHTQEQNIFIIFIVSHSAQTLICPQIKHN